MDPFLEAPARWRGVHNRLINTISDYLADSVTPHFFVEIEERVYITTPDDIERRSIVPDVYLVRGAGAEPSGPPHSGVITAPVLVESAYAPEMRDQYLTIRDTRSRDVITTLEVLSPFNKAPGTQGYEAFGRKRSEVMASSVHWIEIDLLRAGERRQRSPARATTTRS
jgi:hypothetical protein